MGWIEERRFEWVPIAHSAISHLMNGTALVVITDREREWFGKYLINLINRPDQNRPFLPIFLADGLFSHLDNTPKEGLDLIGDLFSLAFKNHILWYIGKSDDPRSALAKKREDSFLWIMNEEVQNSFFLRSADELLDIKLMHLARLFNKTIDAVMFGEI